MRDRIVPLLVALACSACVAPELRVEQNVGQLDIEGDLAVSSMGTATSSSVESLGFEEDEGFYYPRVELEWLGFTTSVAGFQGEFSGNGIAESTLDLGTDVINPGDPVASDLELGVATAAFTFDVVPTDVLDVGIGLGLGWFDYDASIVATTTNMSVASEESFPIAFLALRLASEIGRLRLVGRAGGLEVDLGDEELTYLDIDVAGHYRLFSTLGQLDGHLTLGYRYLRTDLEYEDQGSEVDADLRFDGPYLGLTFTL